jgi:hypothetical protein
MTVSVEMLTALMLQVVQPHLSKMSDRKAELERKKAKLAQIRAEKEARRKEREALDTQTAAKVCPSFSTWLMHHYYFY